MISQELLYEVTGIIGAVELMTNDKRGTFLTIATTEKDENFNFKKAEINIHELAHKCKEWAFDLGYDVETSPSGYVRISKNEYIILSDSMFGKEKKEAENSIKACQWILENKDKK